MFWSVPVLKQFIAHKTWRKVKILAVYKFSAREFLLYRRKDAEPAVLK